MATAVIEVVDEGNNLVYTFQHEDDLNTALIEADGDIAAFSGIEWVESRPRTSND
jgi:hypothetical protein